MPNSDATKLVNSVVGDNVVVVGKSDTVSVGMPWPWVVSCIVVALLIILGVSGLLLSNQRSQAARLATMTQMLQASIAARAASPASPISNRPELDAAAAVLAREGNSEQRTVAAVYSAINSGLESMLAPADEALDAWHTELVAPPQKPDSEWLSFELLITDRLLWGTQFASALPHAIHAHQLAPDNMHAVGNLIGALRQAPAKDLDESMRRERDIQILIDHMLADPRTSAGDRAKLLETRAGMMDEKSDHDGALREEEKAVALAEREFAPDNSSLYPFYENYSIMLGEAERYEEALVQSQRAFSVLDKSLPVDHPYRGRGWLSLAIAHRALGTPWYADPAPLGTEKRASQDSHDAAEVDALRHAIPYMEMNREANRSWLRTVYQRLAFRDHEIGNAAEACELQEKLVELLRQEGPDAVREMNSAEQRLHEWLTAPDPG